MRLRPDLEAEIIESRRRQNVAGGMLAIAENVRGQLDAAMDGWSPIGGDSALPVGVNSDPSRIREESKRAYYQEPFGKVVIRNFVKFVIGQGTIIDWEEKDEKKLESILSWWKKATVSIRWFAFQREYCTRLFRDGEVFVRKFIREIEPLKLRFIDPDKIPDEAIITDESDIETEIEYKLNGRDQEGVSAEFIHHLKNADANVKRGRPILEANLPYITKYKKWLDARMVLNIVRASVAIVQQVQGSSPDLLRIAAKQKAQDRGKDGDRTKMLQPGSIIRGTPGVEYKMLSPNLDAKDASEDGRTIQLAMAAGAGFPDTFITSDYSHNNFASSVVAQNPAIREFEDWQQFIAEAITTIVDWIIFDGVEKGAISPGAKLGYTIGFPPLLKRDINQETSAYSQMNERGVMSRRTWQMKAGLDPEAEARRLAEEEPVKNTQTKTENPPKRVEDRMPRQQQATGSSEGRKVTLRALPSKPNSLLSVSVVKEGENGTETLRNYEIKCEDVRPEQQPHLVDDEPAESIAL